MRYKPKCATATARLNGSSACEDPPERQRRVWLPSVIAFWGKMGGGERVVAQAQSHLIHPSSDPSTLQHIVAPPYHTYLLEDSKAGQPIFSILTYHDPLVLS